MQNNQMGARRKSGISDETLIEKYKKSLSVGAVHKETGVSKSVIYRVLERHGVERVGLAHYRLNAAKFSPETELEIRRRYEAGEYFSQLVHRFGGTQYSVKAAIKRAGGSIVPVLSSLTEDEKARILELRAAGHSQMKISIEMNRSQPLISRFLSSRGDIYKPRSGEAHPNWKGGRYIDQQGYVRTWVRADDPMRCMALSSGHVLEHRLVMARQIGRPLNKRETVHHINGDKQDNRLENLQLRQGNHGKHIAMCCHDCGSTNVGPTKLKGRTP